VHGTNGLVDTDKVLRLFSERIGVARQKYMEFMTRGDSNTNPWPYAAYKQQIIGDERFVEKIEKRIENIEKRAKKIPIRDLLQAIEEEMGVGLPELISRRRGGRLRTARGIFVTLAKETGYKMVDIGRILKRDISVLSRLANISEMREGAKALQKVRMRLNA
jgi:chromosomal replication initiation ATPase DnaA